MHQNIKSITFVNNMLIDIVLYECCFNGVYIKNIQSRCGCQLVLGSW